MAEGKDLNAYEKPPVFIKDVYKSYQRLSRAELDEDAGILDFSHASKPGHEYSIVKIDSITGSTICVAYRYLQGGDTLEADPSCRDVQIYEARHIPGEPQKV